MVAPSVHRFATRIEIESLRHLAVQFAATVVVSRRRYHAQLRVVITGRVAGQTVLDRVVCVDEAGAPNTALADFERTYLLMLETIDDYIVAGDPRFAQPPRRSITFPAEQSTLPLVAGTVVLKPVGAAPPANGSTFVILLKPQPAWTGQVTVLGQVTRGGRRIRLTSR